MKAPQRNNRLNSSFALPVGMQLMDDLDTERDATRLSGAY